MLAEKTGEERRRRPKARVDFMVGGGLGKWYNGEGSRRELMGQIGWVINFALALVASSFQIETLSPRSSS